VSVIRESSSPSSTVAPATSESSLAR